MNCEDLNYFSEFIALITLVPLYCTLLILLRVSFLLIFGVCVFIFDFLRMIFLLDRWGFIFEFQRLVWNLEDFPKRKKSLDEINCLSKALVLIILTIPFIIISIVLKIVFDYFYLALNILRWSPV